MSATRDRAADSPSMDPARSFGPLLTVDGRLRFLDLARGIAIVLMVLQHVQLLFAVDYGETSAVGTTFLLLGTAPAAPVFMVSMGFLFGASRRTGVWSGLRRGIALFALGYALNLVRFTAPALAAHSVLVEDALGGAWHALLEIDILQLAGLSLIVLGVVKHVVRGAWPVVAMAIAVTAVAPLLWGTGGGSPVLDPLWGTAEWVSFPLFPWLAYPLLGLALARFAQRAASAGALMRAWARSRSARRRRGRRSARRAGGGLPAARWCWATTSAAGSRSSSCWPASCWCGCRRCGGWTGASPGSSCHAT